MTRESSPPRGALGDRARGRPGVRARAAARRRRRRDGPNAIRIVRPAPSLHVDAVGGARACRRSTASSRVRHRQLGELGADRGRERARPPRTALQTTAPASRPRSARSAVALRRQRRDAARRPCRARAAGARPPRAQASTSSSVSPYLRVSAAERGAAVLDRREPGRVGLDAGGVATRGRRRRRRATAAASARRSASDAELGVVLALRVEGTTRQRTRARARRRRRRALRRRAAPRAPPTAASRSCSAYASRARLGAERLALARLRGHGLDLREAVPQQVGLLRALAGVRGDLGELGLDARAAGRTPRGTPPAAPSTASPANRSSAAALARRRQQPLLVALPVHGDEVVGQLGEHRRRHRAAAEERAAAALAGDGPGERRSDAVVEVSPGVVDAVDHALARRRRGTGPRPRRARCPAAPRRRRPGRRAAGRAR